MFLTDTAVLRVCRSLGVLGLWIHTGPYVCVVLLLSAK